MGHSARGTVAAGHPETAAAMAATLRDGGNAFDAAVAGAFAACVVEPVLASLGGGGFLLARVAGQAPTVVDFFVQTPRRRRADDELDFRPVFADFGRTRQEFQVGLGSIATPGVVGGLCDAHRSHGRLPLADVVAPAERLAREGAPLNDFQAAVFRIVAPIFTATAEARALYCRPGDGPADARLLSAGETLRQPELAATLARIAAEGDAPFRDGDLADALAALCRDGGGALTRADLAGYRAERREPLAVRFGDWTVWTNPPPSIGGALIALGLATLDAARPRVMPRFGTADWLDLVASVLARTNLVRRDTSLAALAAAVRRDPSTDPLLRACRDALRTRARCFRGTTHMNAIDRAGNVATLTLSNGEGCGHLLPGTGIMLNNMLGEDDLCPLGFNRWEEDRRMASMMAPCIADGPDDRVLATGSGGSKRIRASILQVLLNVAVHDMAVQDAVTAPRISVEGERLSVEGGFDGAEVERLLERWPDSEVWRESNLYFGGAHTVEVSQGRCLGAGDPRRGGVCLVVD